MNKDEFLKKDRQFGMSEKYNKEFESDLNAVLRDNLTKFKDYFNHLPYEGINDILDEQIDNFINNLP